MKNNIKFTYLEVKDCIEDFGYYLISNEYINNKTKLIIKDIYGYYYFISFQNFKITKKGVLSRIVDTSNPYSIQNIKLWCKLNNKPFELLSNEYIRSDIKLTWKCLKEKCQEEFKMTWDNILANESCPYCLGYQVGLSNCLATKNLELAKQWHPTLNGDLTPYNITANCGKKVWWICDKGHEWEVSVDCRNKDDCISSCPYCIGQLPSKDYNLLIINPDLCKEWNYNINNKKPEEYCPNSGDKVWWKCKVCNHEWEATIDKRNKGRGCPACNNSKGEKRISEYLKQNNVFNIPQKEFDNLVGLGNKNLSYDFYLPDYNLLIEYQGEQHEHYCKGFHKSKKDFEKQLEHDRRKKEYAQNNNIKLLEIWYWDFDNIEEILFNNFFIHIAI